jgi:hypothetical protein
VPCVLGRTVAGVLGRTVAGIPLIDVLNFFVHAESNCHAVPQYLKFAKFSKVLLLLYYEFVLRNIDEISIYSVLKLSQHLLVV